MRQIVLALLALLAVFTLSCSIGCSATSPSTDASQDTRTVATAFGDVKVPIQPQRVVALGWGDAETALALGIQPVGASDWLAFGGEGVGPWSKGLYDSPPQLIGTLEPELEKIAGLRPDLILDTKSSGDRDRYTALSKIAPTVGIPQGGEMYNTTWQAQVGLVAEALGRSTEGERLIADTTKALSDAAAANPQFTGKTAVVGARTSEGFGVYVERDSRTQFLHALGFESPAAVQKLPSDSFSVSLSREDLDLLDADLTIITAIGVDNDKITEDSVLRRLPSVRAGHLVTFDDPSVRLAFSTNTAPSIAYAAKVVPPLLSEKL